MERRAIQYLPTWEIRQAIWLKHLTLELSEKGYVGEVTETDLCEGIETLHMDAGLTPPEVKTIKKWVNKSNYPKGEKLDRLLKACPSAAKWLKTDYSDEPLHSLLNAIDYYCCSIQPNRHPTLFSTDEQKNFARGYLERVAARWEISSIIEGNECNLVSKLQDISLSKLQTHGHSAIPLYLCCVAQQKTFLERDCLDWYIDLLCSTLIVTANLYRQNFGFGLTFPLDYSDKAEYMGTCPNLLNAIGRFLLLPENDAVELYRDDSTHGGFDEILNSEKLLQAILSGNKQLNEPLESLTVDSEQINATFRVSGASEEVFVPKVHKDHIRMKNSLSEPISFESRDLLTFRLLPEESSNPRRIVKIINGGSPELIACRAPKKRLDNHYSWGYGGTGVKNAAYTLIFEVLNHRRYGVEKQIPSDSQMDLLVYKILSRLYSCFEYSLSSIQVLEALKEPLPAHNTSSSKFVIQPALDDIAVSDNFRWVECDTDMNTDDDKQAAAV
ncbi:hypothetical protein Q7C_1417 [Methylophaga frappieri]|uniref:Uncharacterized protein n=1 Tax=Methylophaga frappieri (strain ATCC BAA-2434 / DSM 25690 / JAM7) TaxID=754477 RepID=I1YI24_METFJ|nr:hypothetical protein [Methylophaga frappieri]AFJ02567.1 hypothetical protein Q7C_1417 [Methylophaga frappieri]